MKVIPKNSSDKKKAELLEMIINKRYLYYQDIAGTIMHISLTLKELYGDHVEIPENLIDELIEKIASSKDL